MKAIVEQKIKQNYLLVIVQCGRYLLVNPILQYRQFAV